jgi:hypothetical protein
MSVSVSTSVRPPTRLILYRETRRARLGCPGVGLTGVHWSRSGLSGAMLWRVWG